MDFTPHDDQIRLADGEHDHDFAAHLIKCSGFRVQGSGFRVQGAEFRVQGSGFRVQGSWFRVQGSGFRVQGSGFRVEGAGCRASNLEQHLRHSVDAGCADSCRGISVRQLHIIRHPSYICSGDWTLGNYLQPVSCIFSICVRHATPTAYPTAPCTYALRIVRDNTVRRDGEVGVRRGHGGLDRGGRVVCYRRRPRL